MPLAEDWLVQRQARVTLAARQGVRKARLERAGCPEALTLLEYAESEWGIHDGNRPAFNVVLRYLRALDEGRSPKCGFGLWGGVGAGKSTLLASFVAELVQREREVLYLSLPETQLQHYDPPRFERLLDLYHRLVKVPYLVLDEMGQEGVQALWIDRFLAPLINERWRLGRPTFYGSTYDLDQLPARWSDGAEGLERVSSAFSRLRQRNSVWVKMIALDPSGDNRAPEIDF